jgi:hypothetical protein
LPGELAARVQDADVDGVAADVAVARDLAGDALRDTRRAQRHDVALVVEEHEIEVARRTDRERRIVTGLDAGVRRSAQVGLIPLERDDRQSGLPVRKKRNRLQDRDPRTRVEIVEADDRRLAAVQVLAALFRILTPRKSSSYDWRAWLPADE